MSKPPRHRRPLIEALEPRLLFSATADIAVFDDGASDGQYLAQAAEQVDLVSIYMPSESLVMDSQANDDNQVSDVEPQADLPLNESPAVTTLVFVDTAVDDYETLVEDIRARLDDASVAIVYLDSSKDGLGQISDYLSGASGISAIHVISHGVAGNLQLGTQVLNENNISQFKQQLTNWQTALGDEADILLYGCDLAANDSGLNLLRQLSDLTGADVAASNDLTGNSRADADWVLEERIGQVETQSLFAANEPMEWQGVLADVVHLYSGVATNEQAIPTAGYVMQGVQLTSSHTVDRIQVMLANHGTSSSTVQVLVHQHSYNGTVVASATVNTASLGSSLSWVNFDFAQTTFDAYTIYWIEFKTNNGADNLVGIGYINSNVIASEFVVNGSGDGSRDMAIALIDVENRVPTVANAIPNQTATEEALFSYTFAANTFSDQDGDTLTYTATLSNNGPLPPWLNFNAATRTFSGVPDDGDVGTISVKVTASDGKGGTIGDTFDLVINNVNDLPFVSTPVPNQNATEDSVFNYTFPANTFGDGDVSTTFTYTAELSGGGALPAWLSFDSATRTFSGTPANGDVGTISIKLMVSDGAGGSASDTFDIVIANTNDAPVVANSVADQNAIENSLFNYSFPINTFSDPDVGDTLTYSAQLAGALPLPGWLTFDGNTRTFSGTPSNGDVGTITVRVTATDGAGSFTTHDFDIVVQNVGSTNSIIDTSGSSGHTQVLSPGQKIYQSFTNNFGTGTYTIDSIILQLKKDPSAAAQTITVTLLAGAYNSSTVVGTATMSSSALDTSSTWKAFDFTNTVLNDSTVYYIAVESSGSDGLIAVGIHNIDAYPDGTLVYSSGTPDPGRDLAFQVASGANTDPVLLHPIVPQSATEDVAYNFQFASDTFNDADVGDTLTYTVTLDNGDPIPAWLSFNSSTRTFSGTPANGDVGTISIRITAADGNGGTPATDTFDLVIANSNDAPTVANPIPNQTATEDSVFNFTFSTNVFTDQDVGNTLSYSAQLAGGGALPAWLSFDSATRTFSGTPTNAFVGTVSIDVIASDGNGGTVTDTFNIVVGNTNDAPSVANPILDQNATEDSAFNFQFAANTFSDPDVADTLIYSAQLAGGGALPSWLSFNAATRTFSGIPANDDVGSFFVDVTAIDGNGGLVTDTFSITVANVNDAPTVSIALTDYYTDEQVVVNLHGTGISVADVDGNPLTVTLTGAGSNSNLAATVGTTGVVIVSGVNTDTLILSGTAAQLNDLFAGNGGSTLTYRLSGDTPAATRLLTISASDGSLSGSDTAIINITAVNDGPANTVPGAQSTNEDTALVFSLGNANQIQVNDLDVGSGDLEITLSVTNGTLTLAGVTGLVFTTGDGTADSSLVFRGTQTDINTALSTLTFNPTANYTGAAVLTITTSDLGNTGTGGILTDSDTINITVNSSNDAPTVANVIPNQNATEDSAFNFQFAANTFADVDASTTLTYTAQLAGGGSLPTWLSFDAVTRTFSGTPANGDVGTVSIDVIANDGNGGTVTDTFNIVVANVNDAPTVANVIPNQNATEDSAFNFQFAANTFADVDASTTLTYTAQLAGGGSLPTWLSFDAVTRTFSGTPANGDVGTVSIDVIANDGNGGTVTDTFNIVVANVNDAPTVANVIPNQNATEDSAFNFQFAANTFADVDASTTLTYTAQLAGGGSLPTWLSFNVATRTFSGTPANGDVGTVSIDVIANDGNGGTVTDTFNITVANTNDAPTIANAIPNQNATENAAFNFQFAANTFADIDVGNTLTYTAQLAGGGALPTWLSFDAVTRTFSGGPTTADVGSVNIDVIASDGNGGAVTDTFSITVAGLPDTEYIDTGDGGPFTPVSSTNQLGQSFSYNSAGATYTVNEISLSLARYGSAAPQTITVELRDAWNGAVLASASIPSSQISSDGFGWHSFNFAGVALNDQQTYVIQISSTGSDDSVLVKRATGDVFPDGTVIENGVPDVNWDLAFKLAKDDGTNAAPVFDNPITDQSINAEDPFTLVVPVNTSSDPDVNDTITYRAQLAGGGSLGWLTFNEATRTFSGTPHWYQAGTMTVELIATDNHGASTSDFFDITVVNTNNAPTVANPIPDQVFNEDAAFSFQFAANTFADVDAGNTFTYSAELAILGGLPSWLSFDAATRTFSGTPANGDVGNWTIDVTANDGFGGIVVDTFIITVANTNDAPTLANAIPDRTATQGSAFNFQFDTNTFADQDVGDLLTFTAQLAGGGALPTWLSFDAATRTFSGTPANGDVSTISIDVIANDGNGGIASDTFNIVVNNINDAPTVANAIPNQNATEDTAFNFQFAANTFADVDAGSTLTYSVQLASGGTLPAWLNFDATTRTFSGTPANGDVGTINIDVIASDGQGGTVTDTFTLVIANTNDAPTLANPIANQNATENSAFNFQFAGNTFSDVDVGNTLMYTVQLAGGGALPTWLSFDAATRTFSGTPVNGDVGTISIDVIANDGSGGTLSDTFDIVVNNINDAPTVANAIPNQNATEDTAFSFQFAANTFADADAGSVLTYTVQLAGGGAIPAWLSFDAATRTFSGTPANGDVGTINIDVIASDGQGGAVTDTFTLVIANTNDAPTLANPIANQNATENSAFNFQFAGNTFSDVDVGNTLTYTVQLAGGGALPTWLSFDAATRTFSGTPVNGDVGTISIDVIANDGNGGIASDTFNIVVNNINDAPTVANAIPNQNATEDAAFNFQFAANTFADVDAGSVLTYTVQLAGGAALPAWLSFDAATRTFSGTPANGDVGTINIDVIANDGQGGTVTDTFTLVIANTNDVPTLANPIADQTANEDVLFGFTIPANTFVDADGDTLIYSAQLAGGGALPAWLSFDAATRTFNGTPTEADLGSVAVQVSVSDGLGGMVNDTFVINVTNVNDAPVVVNPPANQAAQEDVPFTVTFGNTLFADADANTTLVYTAQLASGAALPAWLSFNATNLSFSGTPTNSDTGVLTIRIIASDGIANTSAQFQLTVSAVNDAPQTSGFAPVNSREDAAGDTVDLWAGFSDEETADNQLQFTVVSNSNPALVSGAVIDPVTGKLQLRYGVHQFGSSDLVIRALDSQGVSVETSLRVNIVSVNDTPTSMGIADMHVLAGTEPQQTNLLNVFSDVEQGTQLQYSLVGNSNAAVVTQVRVDAATGMMTLTFSSSTGGESIITLRALDAEGAWVETQFKVTVVPANIVIPLPEEPVTPPPTIPPVMPPIEQPEVELPEVNPPGTGGGTGGGEGDGATNPEESLNPVLPGMGNSFGPTTSDDENYGRDGFVNDKSSRDYLRAEESLDNGNVPLLTLTASPSLSSLIAPDAGFAPWEAEDFDSEVRRIRAQMDDAMEEEQDRKAVVAGLTFSVTTGLLVWSLRASSLLLTMMSMLPLWRGIDPLPILDEVDKKKKKLEQQRKDRAREDKNAKEVGYLFDHAQGKKSRP